MTQIFPSCFAAGSRATFSVRMGSTLVLAAESIRKAVIRIRGHHVLLDSDLAGLYGVDVKVLNQAVTRNRERFPPDFMFRLTSVEASSLRSQIVTLKTGRGRHRKYLPNAFTEQGVAMLSSVLRSPRAIRVNIEIMRAFVRLRRIFGEHAELRSRLDALERKYDGQFHVVFEAIRELMEPSRARKRPIGFRASDEQRHIIRAFGTLDLDPSFDDKKRRRRR